MIHEHTLVYPISIYLCKNKNIFTQITILDFTQRWDGMIQEHNNMYVYI